MTTPSTTVARTPGERAEAERVAQGLSPQLDDPVVAARIARIVDVPVGGQAAA